MTDFGDTLNRAIETSKERARTDVNNLVWKYKNGTSKRLMDMDQDELQKCYDHCNSMLYSKTKTTPGNK